MPFFLSLSLCAPPPLCAAHFSYLSVSLKIDFCCLCCGKVTRGKLMDRQALMVITQEKMQQQQQMYDIALAEL